MIRKLHSSHMGVESFLRKAQEVFYWPLMSAEIKDYVSGCSVCNTLQPLQCHEPLKSHDIPNQPWSKVATDLFTFNGDNYIVIVDYYSNCLEIDRLRSTSSNAVMQSLKKTFARHGIPDIVVSDNRYHYASDKFRKFASAWEFNHVTTLPHYPQANEKAESVVKICKNLMKKSQLSKSDVYLALLDHRNTPTEQTNLSPAQRLFGRRTRTCLPMSPLLFKPELQCQVEAKITAGQSQQAKYYNRRANSLPELHFGQTVRMKLPNDKWSLGTYKGEIAPRSYLIECAARTYRRNCQHLRTTHEKQPNKSLTLKMVRVRMVN